MEQLKQALAQEDTVLFVGSGISLWSGLPSWPRMIEELAQFVEKSNANAQLIRAEAVRGDLLQAASYGFDKLTKQQIGEFIRSACRYGIAKPHEIHRKIVSLGPKCFITTNYDNLIEQSLQKWQPDRFYPPPVSNRQLTEMAGIVHARAIDFIFKPHGDAADSESIVLTREQYRQLLPQGERQAALESVKMLLASRPVIYLGFGLRDPDFIYMRDLLSNTYKGGTRDHYAIMADVTEPEIDYWRRNYGIHLFGYETVERPDKSRDHAALLPLLDSLIKKEPVTVEPPVFDPKSPTVLLALARHAAALGRVQKITPEFSIRVHSETKRLNGSFNNGQPFNHIPVEAFLDAGPNRAVMVGLPGAGKTYALRCSVARLADCLHQACLDESCDLKTVVVPIFADLKLYQGDLKRLVSQTLPGILPFSEIVRFFKLKIFLDSFNEMPREFWESGSYESDFQKFIKELGDSSLIIGSRTTDGLLKLEIPAYCLDQIDEAAIESELKRLNISFTGRFSNEFQWLLQRPFYFHYIATRAIVLPVEPHPRDFYKALFANLDDAFFTRFQMRMDFERHLSPVAYEALNRGLEAFPVSDLLASFKASFSGTKEMTISAEAIVNWLVSASILIPHTGKRIAFVHQSVTEFLAATELASRYLSNAAILKEKLALMRWDQALLLTLSLLPPEKADEFLEDVIKTDFVLALNAAKYLESDRDKVAERLLSEVPIRRSFDVQYSWKISAAIESSLPLNAAHEASLWRIVDSGGALGAAAVGRLVEIKGEKVKHDLLELLFEKRSDYNLCRNGIGPALQAFARAEDIQKIADWADLIQANITPETEESEFHGFTNGAGSFLENVDLSLIRSILMPADKTKEIPRVRASILQDIAQDRHTVEGLKLATDLLLQDVDSAAFAIHMILHFPKEDTLSYELFTDTHIEKLVANLKSSKEPWEVDAIRDICAVRPDLAELVKLKALVINGVEKAALLYCVSPEDIKPIFSALSELVGMSQEVLSTVPVRVLSRIEYHWSEQEALLVQLLRLRDSNLARALFGGSFPPEMPGLGVLDIGHIDWWLEWMLEVQYTADSYWFLTQLGSVLANYVRPDVVDRFVAEFNNAISPYRRLLMKYVIPQIKNITTDALNDDTISFLFANLNNEEIGDRLDGHLLGKIATERFVAERLLPLLSEAQPQLKKNLQIVLNQAGSRHGRRYVVVG